MNQEKASQSAKRPDREQVNNSRRGKTANHKGGGPKVPRAAMVPNNKEKKPPHCGEGSERRNSNKLVFEEQVVDKIEEIKAEMANGDPDPGGGTKVMGILEQQSSLIRRQRDDIEDLRRKLEDNAKLADVFKDELNEIRKKVEDNGTKTAVSNGTSEGPVKEETAPKEEGTLKAKVDSLTAAYNDIQDRLYEIDKSWKNNLVVYGIAAESSNEEDPAITEEKVRDVFHKKLHISREIPISRITRIWHGPDFRGHKPIQVCIVNYRDKEEILRKARLLKGSNIYVSEDFSRKVREHRHELIKFMKEVRGRDPGRRMTLRYDKLYMGHDVFFFNDRSGRVERMHNSLDTAGAATIANAIMESSSHDPSWLRRPRSRTHSRGTTPPPSAQHHSTHHLPSLSRQSSLSISMDELNSPAMHRRRLASAGTRRHQQARTNGSGGVGGRSSMSRRQRAAAMTNSADSFDYESDNNASSSPVLGSPTKSYYNGGVSGNKGEVENGISSATASPTKTRKTVAFSGVPDSPPTSSRQENGHSSQNSAGQIALEQDQERIVVNSDNESALVPYHKHEVVPANHHNRRPDPMYDTNPPPNSSISAVTSTVLPPIGVDYATPRNFPMNKFTNGHVSDNGSYYEDQSNLPSILQSSLGKLEMNFLQNCKSLEMDEPFRAIEGPSASHANGDVARLTEDRDELERRNEQHPNGHGNNILKQANGVLKVAMYGEFPISSVSATTTTTNSNSNNSINSSRSEVVARTNHISQQQQQH